MKKQLLLLAAACLLGMSNLTAQTNGRNCGTMGHLQQQLNADPTLQQRMDQVEQFTQNYLASQAALKTTTVVTIPVVFHVLYSTNNATQNISDARINEQLHVLNLDYSRTNADAGNTPAVFQGISVNTNIQFCLAVRDPNGAATTGIIRKLTGTTSFIDDDGVKFNAQGGDDAWPAGSYLNLWVCNLGGGLLGYAQFPGGPANTDGVVVLNESVGGPAAPGTATSYNLGRTATHEVGHWLNLRHVWGDANCGNDLVSDTPTQQTSNFGCPSFPHVTCSNGPNGDMFMNYMDYVDDNCMNAFTAGQSSRSNALLISGGARFSLTTSQGCSPVGGGCGIPGSLSATSVAQTSATVNWGAVSGATTYTLQYRVSGGTLTTVGNLTTTSKALSGLTAGTVYDYHVKAVCSGTSGTYSAYSHFTTTSGGGC
ncbi:MAG: M43 family zinc metalloprotease, partial [Bacteroidia bacterium]